MELNSRQTVQLQARLQNCLNHKARPNNFTWEILRQLCVDSQLNSEDGNDQSEQFFQQNMSFAFLLAD